MYYGSWKNLHAILQYCIGNAFLPICLHRNLCHYIHNHNLLHRNNQHDHPSILCAIHNNLLQNPNNRGSIKSLFLSVPDSRYPIISVRTIGPIAWGPYIAINRALRLVIYLHYWRCNCNLHTYLCIGFYPETTCTR